jgi:hypothetical protein
VRSERTLPVARTTSGSTQSSVSDVSLSLSNGHFSLSGTNFGDEKQQQEMVCIRQMTTANNGTVCK